MLCKKILFITLLGVSLAMNAHSPATDDAPSYYLYGGKEEDLKDPEVQRQLKGLADSKEVKAFNKLYNGIDKNNIQLVKEALSEGTDLNGEGMVYLMHSGIRAMPLFLACLRGREEIVELLLKHGADTCAAYAYPITIEPGPKFYCHVGNPKYLRVPTADTVKKIKQYIETPGVLGATGQTSSKPYVLFRGFTAFHGACINPKQIVGVKENVAEAKKLRIIKMLYEAEKTSHTNDEFANATKNKHCRILSYDPFIINTGNIAHNNPEMPSDLARAHGYSTIAELMEKLENGQEVSLQEFSQKGLLVRAVAVFKKLFRIS